MSGSQRTVALLFTSHNRLEFTRLSFAALLENTNWEMVDRLHVCDDESRDGTYEFLAEAVREAPRPATLTRRSYKGSVAALAQTAPTVTGECLAKIDNDVIVCPGWLDVMLDVLSASPRLDALGMEPGFGARYSMTFGLAEKRVWKPARWIGGVGLFRTGIFRGARLRQNDRYFGLTAFWRRYATTGWITPDLPVFLLDKLPFEPWRSLTQRYVAAGWSREWPEDLLYPPEMEPYWAWHFTHAAVS